MLRAPPGAHAITPQMEFPHNYLRVNSRHPGPRRVWKVGSGARLLPPLPLDPVDPLDPLDPLESSVMLIFVRRRGKIEHLSRDDPPPGSPGGSGQPRVSPVRPWASFGDIHIGDVHIGDVHIGDVHIGKVHIGNVHIGDQNLDIFLYIPILMILATNGVAMRATGAKLGAFCT